MSYLQKNYFPILIQSKELKNEATFSTMALNVSI